MKVRTAGSRGFSLIELMIVVAVIGILAGIAYPSYQDYIAKTRRADAQAALTELAQFMERRYTSTGRYGTDDDCGGVVLPFAQSPRDGGTAFYNIAVACDAGTFTLTATPAGPMSADACGNLTLSHTGAKGRSGSLDLAQCWRR